MCIRDRLPAAFGVDIGTIWKPTPRVWLNTAIWYLFLEQEFVYVGDEGVVEPSGRSARQGIDIGGRFQLTDYLFFDSDFTYTLAKAIDEPDSSDRIPLAPVTTAAGGFTFQLPNKFSASLRYRYIGDRAANEDNSIVAEGYFITDFNTTYTFKNLSLGLNIENIFDREWNETQFATESRLFEEPESTEEIHFTPGTPLFVKGMVRYRF